MYEKCLQKNVLTTKFHKYSKENFNLRFGRPQNDTYLTCEVLNAEIKSQRFNENTKKVAVVELLVHKCRSIKFYIVLSSITKLCMVNHSMPQIPVQDNYYFSHFTVCDIGVHNLFTRSMKCYHEGEASKEPNEVIYFINHYIENEINEEVECLYIFCDKYAG